MTEWLIAIVIGIALGLAIGLRISRDSDAKAPVRGGTAARASHYLACAALASMLPFILAGLVLGLEFLTLFGTAVGFVAAAAISLLVYAAAEPSAAPTH